jgi:hypothetical protein
MPPERFGVAQFAGAKSFLSCQYTCSHGVSPGQGTFDMAPQEEPLEEISDLVLSDGVTTVTVPRCKIYDFDFSVGPRGQRITLCFYDRRVFWEHPTVSGRYNQPQESYLSVPQVPYPLGPQGNPNPPPPPPDPNEAPIKPWTKKTARELAKLCLEAMGEKDYSVEALDETATPTVEWDQDNAAQALSRLCEDLGCRVVYRPDEDRVIVCRQGQGDQLPGGAILEGAPSVKIPDTPDKIVLKGDYSQFQMRFALEAVGEDFDGKFVPINQLSYRPTTGDWSGAAPPCFANIPPDTAINNIVVGNPYLPGQYRQADAQQLASQWVYRAYRIKLTAADGTGKLVIPPDSKDLERDTVSRRELVRLLPVGCATVWDDLGKLAGTPARVFGRHTPPAAQLCGPKILVAYGQTTTDTEVKVPFTVRCDDRFVGIIFHGYVYALKNDGKVYPAEIVLETACNVASNKTFQFARYLKTLDLNLRRGIGPATVVKNDVQYRGVALYRPGNQLYKVVDNHVAVDARAQYYLQGELRNYAGDTCERDVYPGFVAVFPDGAIHQVTFQAGGGQGCRTEASRNSEHNKYLPQYAARRRIEETDLNAVRRQKEQGFKMRQFLNNPAAVFDRAGA